MSSDEAAYQIAFRLFLEIEGIWGAYNKISNPYPGNIGVPGSNRIAGGLDVLFSAA